MRTDCLSNSTACFVFAPRTAFDIGWSADTTPQPSLPNLQPRVLLTPLFPVLPQMAIPRLGFGKDWASRLPLRTMPINAPLFEKRTHLQNVFSLFSLIAFIFLLFLIHQHHHHNNHHHHHHHRHPNHNHRRRHHQVTHHHYRHQQKHHHRQFHHSWVKASDCPCVSREFGHCQNRRAELSAQQH